VQVDISQCTSATYEDALLQCDLKCCNSRGCCLEKLSQIPVKLFGAGNLSSKALSSSSLVEGWCMLDTTCNQKKLQSCVLAGQFNCVQKVKLTACLANGNALRDGSRLCNT